MSEHEPDSPGLFARDLRARLLQSEREDFAAWPEAEFDAWARRLFALQIRLNAPYGAWCRAKGVDAAGVPDWRDIPAVPTEAFKSLDLTSLVPADRTACFHSSGTTGQTPSRHLHSVASLELYAASLAPWFRRHLLDGFGLAAGERPRFVHLVPPAVAAPRSSLAYMLAEVTARFGAADSVFAGKIGMDGGWEVDLDRALAALQHAVAAGRPVIVTGTAFGFVHLTDGLAARGMRVALPAGSRAMETGGYKGRSRTMPKPVLHGAIRDSLGIADAELVTEYGMSELGSQAYDRAAGRGDGAGWRQLRFPPWCRARVLSPETGAPTPPGGVGVVRVFDLANVWSVAAVQTGDLAREGADGFELIGRASDVEPRGCSLMAV